MQKLKQNRDYLWDNVKFLLIVLVVMGHLADEYTAYSDAFKGLFLFIYAFHMPLFIFISGLFHNEKNRVSKNLFYITVGLLLKIVLSLTDALINGTGFSFSLLSEPSMPWFMFALCGFDLITHFLRDSNRLFILIAAVILACFAGYDPQLGDTFCLLRILVFFPFYWLGYSLKSDRLLRFRRRFRYAAIPAAVVLAGWLGICMLSPGNLYEFRYLFTGHNPYYGDFLRCGALARLLCYAISVLTGLCVILLVPDKRLPGISKWGTRTLNVFFWHPPIISILVHSFHLTELCSAGRLGKAAYLALAPVIAIVLSSGGFVSAALDFIKKMCYSTVTHDQK